MYFSDDPEIIENWFQDKQIRERIKIKTYERANLFEAISSTLLRQAFIENNIEYIQNHTPKAVTKRYKQIKQIIQNTNNS